MDVEYLQESENIMSLLRRRKQEARENGEDPSLVMGKRAELEAKAGPDATNFVTIMLKVLETKGGIANEKDRNSCGYEMNEILRKEFKSLLGPNPDTTLLKMANVLERYGVKDPVVQEDIILDYLTTLKDLGGVKLAR